VECTNASFKWPATLPNARSTVETYIKELSALGERFLLLVASALDLPPETFFPFVSEQHRIKISHYSSLETSDPSSNQGVGAHKDSSGWWTFLLQASPPEIRGLQALNKSGTWIDVPNIPGTFVVNIGQAFEVVTNGVCKATTHRVLSGPSDRYSIPFFQGVRGDLTKEKMTDLWQHFEGIERISAESEEAEKIDSSFLEGKYDTWGEAQLRTKIRSHRHAGVKFYGDVFETYVGEDG
jgi:isopenicillin N synthase-like dioxygenase